MQTDADMAGAGNVAPDAASDVTPDATSGVHIRALQAEDYQTWLPLWQGYQDFYEVSLSSEVSQTTFQRFLDAAEPMHCALAIENGLPVGFVHYIEHRSCWTIGNYCYLQDLFVAQTRRAGGLGRRLIEHVYAFAEAQGCSRVHWLTQHTNARAIALYDTIADKPGFIQYRKIL